MDEVKPDSAETHILLRQVRDGDRGAFDRLFARYRPFLRRVIKLRLDTRLRARLDLSDVIQETQLEAFRRLGDYLERRPMPFRLWLHKTACERLLVLWRRHVDAARRAVGREVPLPDRSSLLLARKLLAVGSSPSQQLARRELACRVREAVERLAPADREVLLMRTFEGLSNAEIGQLLGLDPAAVSQRHGRALLRLHKLLAEGGLTESQL
jgi:RNA polymerase sigma-70 factor (ECF subfamily)